MPGPEFFFGTGRIQIEFSRGSRGGGKALISPKELTPEALGKVPFPREHRIRHSQVSEGLNTDDVKNPSLKELRGIFGIIPVTSGEKPANKA